MCRGLYLTMLLVCFPISSTLALSIGYDGSSIPFTYQQNVQTSFEPVLQVVNDSGVSVVVLSWQLELEVRPLQGAQGELLFQSAGTPPNSLFGQVPGPLSDLSSPRSMVLAFDGDTTDFDGEPVPNQMARNILQLTLVATPDAAGTFQLVMPEFDPANPDIGSSWFEADGFEPVGFDNSAPSAFPGFVLLGTINVHQASAPGDYDSDGVVGPSDYDRWRAHFGNPVSTPGEDADGNRDTVIDAADYVIWRANAPLGTGSGSGYVTERRVPEPGSLFLTVLFLAGGSGWRHRRPRKHQRLQVKAPPLLI